MAGRRVRQALLLLDRHARRLAACRVPARTADGSRHRTRRRQAAPPLGVRGSGVSRRLLRRRGTRSPFLYSVGFTLFALATSVLLYNIVSNRWFAVVLEHRTMLWIGRRSYGIYLWHWPLLVVATKYVGRASYAVAIALPLTFILAALSYRYLEQPALRLKQRYVARPIASPAVASTSLASAGSPRHTDVRARRGLRDHVTPPRSPVFLWVRSGLSGGGGI